MVKTKKTNKQNLPVLNKKKLILSLEKEIQEEYLESIKSKIKNKIKEIRMTEILLEKQKKQLNDLASGKKQYTEEELLFND